MHIVTDPVTLTEVINNLKGKAVAVDVEATGPDYLTDRVVGIGLANAEDEWYIPIDAIPNWAEFMRELWVNTRTRVIAHNLAFDQLFFLKNNCPVSATYNLDTMGLAHLYNEMAPLGLKEQAKLVLDREMTPWSKDLLDGPVEDIAAYCCADVRNTYDLAVWYLRALSPDLRNLYLTHLQPLPVVAAQMTWDGWALSKEAIEADRAALQKQLDILTTKLNGLGLENPNSSRQVVECLERLGAKWQTSELTSTGAKSANKAVLTRLASNGNPAVRQAASLLLTYRNVAKLASYLAPQKGRGLLTHTVETEYGYRVHPRWRCFGPATGRWSCSEPNLQQIPSTRKGQVDEEAVLHPRRWLCGGRNKLVVADLSQAELRVLAALSNDEHLRRAFANGEDIHRAVAARIFNVPADDVTPEQRFLAKTINFAILYGAGAGRVASVAKISKREAEQAMARFFQAFPRVSAWRRMVIEEAQVRGYVLTAFGRPRRPVLLNFFDLLNYESVEDAPPGHDRLRYAAFEQELRKKGLTRNTLTEDDIRYLQERGKRQCVNAIIQGTVADVINRALVRLYNWGFKIVGQVHDEIIIEVEESEAEDAARALEKAMYTDLNGVKLTAEATIGYTWEECH